MNVSALNDGTITYTVTAQDAAAIPLQSSLTTTKNTTTTAASLSGFVYVDFNGSGGKDSGDLVVPDVVITLTGTDAQNNPIPSRTTTTLGDGSYQFTNLAAGTYTLTESKAANLAHGKSSAGSLGGSAVANVISGIAVTAGASGTGYNFNEAGLAPSMVSMRLFLFPGPTAQEIINAAVSFPVPTVTSIVKADADPTSAATVHSTR